jgi:hypothetical protein
MNYEILFSLLLAATGQSQAGAAADQLAKDKLLCPGEAMSIYLPNPEGVPAPNIRMANFQYMSVDDPCGRNVDSNELTRLHASVKPIAAAAFSSSQANFSIMIRFTLTPNELATIDMQQKNAPESEMAKLTQFYNQTKALKNFHSKAGTVYVLFEYEVSKTSLPTPIGKG